MSEIRTLPRCGKPVGEAGHPCLLVPGHAGFCIDGRQTEFLPTIPGTQLEFDAMFKPRRYVFGVPAKLFAMGLILWLIVFFQIWIDVLVITR